MKSETNVGENLNSFGMRKRPMDSKCGLGLFLHTVNLLERTLRSTPVGRFHRWLRSMTPSVASAQPLPRTNHIDCDGPLRAALLPTHLPLPPPEVLSARSMGRLRASHRLKSAAWMCTEWLLTMFTYWNLSSPKSLDQYRTLEDWNVTGEQSLCAYRL